MAVRLLTTDMLQPVEAPISRRQARLLLVEYLVGVGFCGKRDSGYYVELFDLACDEQEVSADLAFEDAKGRILLDGDGLETDISDVERELNLFRSGRAPAPPDTGELDTLEEELAELRARLRERDAAMTQATAAHEEARHNFRNLLVRFACATVQGQPFRV